jgi:alkylhydroperoxidase/carboxymuconolactone decarboxylase family protein YurZ
MSERESYFLESVQKFIDEAPEFAQTWMRGMHSLEEASALDDKTAALATLAVLAAQRMHGAIPFFVQRAKNAGATRNEVISAILVGLPAAGSAVSQALPFAVDSYDGK